MIVGVIPARFASTRLMGKPLATIGKKPMIQHTYENSLKAKLLDKVIIATDDEKIFDTAKGFNADVYLTPKDINTGSDRIAYVIQQIPSAEIVVNIQGDEPFIQGKMIDQAIEPLLFDKSVQVTTLAKLIDSVDDLKASSIPKVVFDYFNNALYFSRSPIPYVREAHNYFERLQKAQHYKHIGLYAYRRNALLSFTKMQPTYLEQIEKLEQLRLLENGIKIKIVVTQFDNLSVDTPDDLERARVFYERYFRELEND